MIGVAAAVQYSVFPVWFGTCLIAGFPSREIVVSRLAAFVINILTITATAAVYAAAGMRKEEVNRFGEFCGAGCQPAAGLPNPACRLEDLQASHTVGGLLLCGQHGLSLAHSPKRLCTPGIPWIVIVK